MARNAGDWNLFPASFGDTDKPSTGGANRASVLVPTGKSEVGPSVLETQLGGDINILRPGAPLRAAYLP
jgi:hypothetical protein